MEQFTYFWHGPFSQWARSAFTVDGVEYTCAEQYMMHQKALIFGDTEKAQEIMDAGFNPKKHKELGRQVRGFMKDKWDKVAKDVVYIGTHNKFTQNPDLLEQLKATKGTTLVEASPFDRIWGIGLAENDPRAKQRATWLGTNWLGEILTEVRIDIFQEG